VYIRQPGRGCPGGESSDGHRFFAEEHEIIQGEGI
jgi:hypothetical protein